MTSQTGGSSKESKQKTLLGFFSKDARKPPAMPRSMPPPSSSPIKSERSTVSGSSENRNPSVISDSVGDDVAEDEEMHALAKGFKRKVYQVDSDDDEDVFSSPPHPSRKRIHKRSRQTSITAETTSTASEHEGTDSSAVLGPVRSRYSSASSTTSFRSETDEPVGSKKSSRGTGLVPRTNGLDRNLTVAERKRAEKKKADAKNEEAYAFLLDPKDKDGARPGDVGYDNRTLHIPKSAWNLFTPFEKQFWEIKQNHFDTVLFFQKGKFYELYEEDARIGHREFDLKLTQRVKMSMVGVPESSFDFWAAKFLARGFKVGRVDQAETALGAEMRLAASKSGRANAEGSGSKIVQRVLNKVFTVGTIMDANLLSDDHATHCVAITEQHGLAMGREVAFGVAILDASTCEISLGFWEDDICRTSLETMIRQLRVKELVFTKGGLSSLTTRVLKSSVSGECLWNPIREAEATNPANVEERLDTAIPQSSRANTGTPMSPDVVEVLQNQATTLALGNLSWYLQQLNIEKDILSMKNFKIYDPLQRSGTLSLDGQTLSHLEILINNEGTEEGTLLNLLARCTTPFGKRLFRNWLCNPLCSTTEINERLDAVEDLMNNPTFEDAFLQLCKAAPDLERITARIHSKSCRVKEFLRVLSSFLRLSAGVKDLIEITHCFTSPRVQSILLAAPDVGSLVIGLQEQFVAPEDEGKATQLHPVDGRDECYDQVQSEIEQIEATLDEKLKELRRRIGASLTYWHSAQGAKEIYLVQVAPGNKNIPATWKKATSTKAAVRYDVPELGSYIRKLKEARETKKAAINDFKLRVYEQFDQHRVTWLSFIRVLAQLDCLLALAKSSAALGQPAVRPEFIDRQESFVAFKELRHPSILLRRDFIPNDISLGVDDGSNRVMLLTGPNMGGKSTVMRMTAIGIIMAQLGMLVPALEAKISPFDKILTRMGAYDNLLAASSTFKVELEECCKIIRNASPKSLIILDELGRGTSTFDGMAVASAVLHYLATHSGAITFFATHYSSLTEDFTYHRNVENMHMSSILDEDKRELVFLYKLVKGVASSSFGTHVASLAGVDEKIVQRADAISRDFASKFKARHAARAVGGIPLTAQADFAFLYKVAKRGPAQDNEYLKSLLTICSGVRSGD